MAILPHMTSQAEAIRCADQYTHSPDLMFDGEREAGEVLGR